MGWLFSLLFLFGGFIRGPVDALSVGIFIAAGLFAISGSIGALATKFTKEDKKEEVKKES